MHPQETMQQKDIFFSIYITIPIYIVSNFIVWKDYFQNFNRAQKYETGFKHYLFSSRIDKKNIKNYFLDYLLTQIIFYLQDKNMKTNSNVLSIIIIIKK